jgi:uncharacterized membrane-anchored protein YjiN (DUF445 family)
LVNEISALAFDIVSKLDDSEVVNFIANKAREMSDELKINKIVGTGLEYILTNNDHQKLITNLSAQIKDYVLDNQQIVQQRVKRESYFLIPKFVDSSIAAKITDGLAGFFEEVEIDPQHSLRFEITEKLQVFADEIQHSESWNEDFKKIKNDFLHDEKLQQYAGDIWLSIKNVLKKEPLLL